VEGCERMVGNGGEVGQHFFRRQSSVNSPRRLSRNVDARDFDSLMEFPKPLQRGVSFRAPAPVVQQQAQHSNVHSTSRSGCQKHVWVAFLLCLSGFLVLYLSYLRRNPFLSQSPQVPSKGYGVVIGIGRREARITVIQFVDAPGTLTVHVLGSEHSVAPLNFETPNGGYDVSAFVELLEYAKRTIPEPVRPQTRVYVLGTGGLEWIPAVNRDVLLEECRNIIHESAFQFHNEWAMVISGECLNVLTFFSTREG
jgi:apyrase